MKDLRNIDRLCITYVKYNIFWYVQKVRVGWQYEKWPWRKIVTSNDGLSAVMSAVTC